jgi:branched-chain amino acid transport system permease protein
MPAIDGSTVKQKLFLLALLVIAVAWPFMVSRGTVDIATLTMIYIILGLGLNVVVGLCVCWCWAMAASMPSVPTPLRC